MPVACCTYNSLVKNLFIVTITEIKCYSNRNVQFELLYITGQVCHQAYLPS